MTAAPPLVVLLWAIAVAVAGLVATMLVGAVIGLARLVRRGRGGSMPPAATDPSRVVVIQPGHAQLGPRRVQNRTPDGGAR